MSQKLNSIPEFNAWLQTVGHLIGLREYCNPDVLGEKEDLLVRGHCCPFAIFYKSTQFERWVEEMTEDASWNPASNSVLLRPNKRGHKQPIAINLFQEVKEFVHTDFHQGRLQRAYNILWNSMTHSVVHSAGRMVRV